MEKLLHVLLKNRLIVFLAFGALSAAGFWALSRVPVDALPDLGENQVIVYADWPGRTPKDVENQITFPLSTALQGITGVKDIRAQSAFGFSMIYVVFKDEVDYYFARTRVLERLNSLGESLPDGVVPTLGPDGSGLGQVFWYTLEGGGLSLQELRSLQDWYVRFGLASVEGVSEVASVGGFVKQYQINVDPTKVFTYGLRNSDLVMAVQNSNRDVGAKVVEANGMEYLIRGAGFLKDETDLEQIVIGGTPGAPLRLGDVAEITVGPEFRRGVLNKDGAEAVGGVVIMRYRGNPAEVIARVRNKISELTVGLPEGVRIVPFYDRTDLVEETLSTLREAIGLEILITICVILVFSLPFTHSLLISLTLPFSVLLAFLLMYLFKVDLHLMSLTGIIIAIGTIVDMAIVITENIHRSLHSQGDPRGHGPALTQSLVHKGAHEVAKAVLGAVLTTVVPFLAILVLDGQSARLFHPVVWTKTFVLIGSLVSAIFLLPPLYLEMHHWERRLKNFDWRTPLGWTLRILGLLGLLACFAYLGLTTWQGLVQGTEAPLLQALAWVQANWMMLAFSAGFLGLTRLLAVNAEKIIRTMIPWCLNHKAILLVPASVFFFSLYILGFRIQNEFRPPLDEGSFLFMPVLLPSASLNQVSEVLETQNRILKSFPEVESAVGKLGRIESATDPADITMIETIVSLRPRAEWRPGVTAESLRLEMNEALRIPGVGNIWTQPIQNRVDMLSTGIRTAVGIKVFGQDLGEIERVSLEIEAALQGLEGLQGSYAERVIGKPYIEYDLDRFALGRYGLSIGEVQEFLETALGGENLTTIISGRERYPVRLRYQQASRENLEDLKNLLLVTPEGARISVSAIADIQVSLGPSMINSENGLLRGIVYLNLSPETGPLEFVSRAEQRIRETVNFPRGYYHQFAGDFQNQIRANEALQWILPLCLFAIFIIIYLGFHSLPQTFFVFLAIPVSLSGGILLLYWLGYKMSIAVAVGFIALFGVAVDDGILLTTFINQRLKAGTPRTIPEIRALVTDASAQRIRPLLMTTATTILALVPVLWATGRGSEILRPMSIPSIGGMTIELLSILVVPVLNSWMLERRLVRGLKKSSPHQEILKA